MLATTRASPRIAPSRVSASRSLYPESPGNIFDTGLKLRLIRIAMTITRTVRVLPWARVGGLEGLCRTAGDTGQRLRVTKQLLGAIRGDSRVVTFLHFRSKHPSVRVAGIEVGNAS
jgi:hypothetical protein